jgi:hypothetical protein
MMATVHPVEGTKGTASDEAQQTLGVWAANRRQRDLLRGLAEQIEGQVEAQARSRLWKVKPLRRLGQLARALVEAHQRGDVPDLLGRVQYRPQLEALLALEAWLAGQAEPQPARQPLAEAHLKRLAAARIQRSQWEEVGQVLAGLLPAPEARSELLFDLSLSRLAQRGYFEGLDAPREALVRLLALADLHEGQSVLVSCFDAGLLAQTLAEEHPTLPASIAGRDRPRVLPSLFPTLRLAEVADLLAQPQPFQRVVFRQGGMHWESQRKRTDIPLIFELYRRLPPGGRVVALLDSNASYPERQPHDLVQWARWNGGQGHLERLNAPTHRWALDLVMMEKRPA